MKTLRIVLASPFLALLYAYRWLLSPALHLVLGPLGGGCRFQPTCSRYAIEALKTYPLHRALWLIVRRVGRCHPWGGEGYDPVPPRMHVVDLRTKCGQDRTDHEDDRAHAQRNEGEPEEKDEHERKQGQSGQADE
ncbi:MAG: membrane protein insertion efficiency factor YidD [Verrucomicrobia bacterium]|nr:membrane protein insertion efficiency factor YidD [Verrucomicrobiota bacterium]